MDSTLIQIINELIRLSQENAALKAKLAELEKPNEPHLSGQPLH